MIKQWFNYRTLLALVAICIVVGTVFYSQYLSQKIALDERKKVEAWVEAQQTILNSSDSASLTLASFISTSNIDIPIIETDEKNNISGNYKNLDSNLIKTSKHYLAEQLAIFKEQNEPIVIVISEKPYMANKYYYGESNLQKEVQYYPIVQLVVVALFLIIVFIAQRTNYRSTQSQLWAGMAKETAHQLGTPVSSLQGWMEILKEVEGNEKMVSEMEKDVQRLLLITDRFGKIGSQPNLEERNIVEQVTYMMDYIKKRAGGKVEFSLDTNGESSVIAMVSPPLFDWVIENMLKNALDAMEGKGKLSVLIKDTASQVLIDITDTGKGISKANISKVFKPGFTTKKRGWGLGLTLTKRIIEQYHKGQIFISHSEVGKGTTFRVVLAK
jgi:signal transduction histidine kinase